MINIEDWLHCSDHHLLQEDRVSCTHSPGDGRNVSPGQRGAGGGLSNAVSLAVDWQCNPGENQKNLFLNVNIKLFSDILYIFPYTFSFHSLSGYALKEFPPDWFSCHWGSLLQYKLDPFPPHPRPLQLVCSKGQGVGSWSVAFFFSVGRLPRRPTTHYTVFLSTRLMDIVKKR